MISPPIRVAPSLRGWPGVEPGSPCFRRAAVPLRLHNRPGRSRWRGPVAWFGTSVSGATRASRTAWSCGGSNPVPSVCQTDALPGELQPQGCRYRNSPTPVGVFLPRPPARRELGSRTPHVLVPNQARSPSRSFPKVTPTRGCPYRTGTGAFRVYQRTFKAPRKRVGGVVPSSRWTCPQPCGRVPSSLAPWRVRTCPTPPTELALPDRRTGASQCLLLCHPLWSFQHHNHRAGPSTCGGAGGLPG